MKFLLLLSSFSFQLAKTLIKPFRFLLLDFYSKITRFSQLCLLISWFKLPQFSLRMVKLPNLVLVGKDQPLFSSSLSPIHQIHIIKHCMRALSICCWDLIWFVLVRLIRAPSLHHPGCWDVVTHLVKMVTFLKPFCTFPFLLFCHLSVCTTVTGIGRVWVSQRSHFLPAYPHGIQKPARTGPARHGGRIRPRWAQEGTVPFTRPEGDVWQIWNEKPEKCFLLHFLFVEIQGFAWKCEAA